MHHRPPNRVNDAENPYQAAALIAARHRGEWRWPTCARRWMSRHQEDGEEGCKEAASALSRGSCQARREARGPISRLERAKRPTSCLRTSGDPTCATAPSSCRSHSKPECSNPTKPNPWNIGANARRSAQRARPEHISACHRGVRFPFGPTVAPPVRRLSCTIAVVAQVCGAVTFADRAVVTSDSPFRRATRRFAPGRSSAAYGFPRLFPT